MSWATEVAADSPSGLWNFDDTSGTSVVDSQGSNNGTYVNSPTLNQSPIFAGTGKSVAFDKASSQEATLPNNGLSTNATVEVLFKWSAGTTIMRDHSNAGGTGWIIGFDNGGTFAVRVAGSTTISTSKATSAVQDGNRHHLMV